MADEQSEHHGRRVLVVCTAHRETRLFDDEHDGTPLTERPILRPQDPHGFRRHLEHRAQTRLDGERAPEVGRLKAGFAE